MEVVLKDITEDAEYKIGLYASACYDANTDRDACIRRAKSCTTSGHLATLRFASAVFHVSGISRACSHQFVRSKHLDFLQQSQRYVNQETCSFVYPNTPHDTRISGAYQSAMAAYKELIEAGVKKEDARMVLPAGAATELYVVGNLQAWKDFIRLRADKHAQREIREVAKEINNQLHKHCPNIFHWMS